MQLGPSLRSANFYTLSFQHSLTPFLYATRTIQLRRPISSSRNLKNAQANSRRLPRSEATDQDNPEKHRPARPGYINRESHPFSARQHLQSDEDPVPFINDETSHRGQRTTSLEVERMSNRFESMPDLGMGHGASSSEDRNSTITVAERRAFEELFRSLRAKEVAKHESAQHELQSNGNLKNPDTTLRKSTRKYPVSMKDIYADLALEGGRVSDIAPMGGKGWSSGSSENLFRRLPASIKPYAAQTALWMAEHTAVERTEQSSQDVNSDESKEVARLQGLIYNSPNEWTMWKVFTDEVLSRIDDMERMARDTKTRTQLARGQHHKDTDTTSSAAPDQAQHEEERAPRRNTDASNSTNRAQIPLPLHAYPALALLLVRLLTHPKRQYSAFPISFLAIIRKHSLTAYNLCASTALYNVVLLHSWRSHSSFSEVMDLLQEMQSAGLQGNANTLEVLKEVLMFRHRAQRGDFGEALAAIELLQGREQEARELQKWSKLIKKSIHQTALESYRRSEEMKRLRNDGVLAEIEELEREVVEDELPQEPQHEASVAAVA